MQQAQGALTLAGRTMLALIFLLSGLGKIGSLAGTQGYMEANGVPGVLIWPAIVLEIGGALAVMVGAGTRWASGLLCVFTVLTAVIFHRQFSDQVQMFMFLKNVAIAGGFLLLLAFGPGRWSWDEREARSVGPRGGRPSTLC